VAWLSKRETETADDDKGRIYNHILPALGDIPLAELRPRQVRDFVDALTKKRRKGNRRKDGSLVPTDELLAPRTVRHIYGTLRAMLNDAVTDELVIEKSYSTKKRKVKGTKTENPREMPVHPTLARILAAWKLAGYEQLTGRTPRPEDPIVPSRRGAYRNANASLRRFHEDLERIGLRARRQHDARRTFISIARADGAVADKLHFATHGPDGEIMDDYTTLPWAALCDEVGKAKISLREGKLVELPMPIAIGAPSGLAAPFAAAVEPSLMTDQSWRSGRDLNPTSASRDDQPSRVPAMTTQACAASGSRFVSVVRCH
jgi:hypothetical protein